MSSLLQVRVPEDVAAKVKELADAERRSVAQWVRLLIEDRLMKEAAAPEDANTNWHPKNRAREARRSALKELSGGPIPPAPAKTSVKGSPAVRVRGTGKPGSGDSNDSPATAPGIISTESPSPHPVRCHCRRGRIIGAGPRKGQCTVCGNPKPLEE